VAGLHGTSIAVGGVLAALALAPLTARFGRKAVSWAGLAGMNAGVLLVVFSDALPVTLTGYGLAGGAGTMALYTMMAALGDHHGPAGPAALSEANAVGVLFGIGASFALSAAAGSTLGWRAALLITPLLTVVLALAMGRVWVPETERPAVARATERRPYEWRFYLAGAVLFCCVATEFGFNLWAAELMTERTGLTPAVAATALTAFTAGLAVGRFAGTGLALRVPAGPLLVGALAVAGAGWALFWVSTHPVLSYTGLVVCGLGASLHFPLALARVIAAAGGRSDHGAGIAALWAAVASGVGPFALGALADGYGTHGAFLLIPVLIAVAMGGVLCARPGRPRPAAGHLATEPP
jgi:predicted MFS family arabinose efflux permease